jgi:hypothetical protein
LKETIYLRLVIAMAAIAQLSQKVDWWGSTHPLPFNPPGAFWVSVTMVTSKCRIVTYFWNCTENIRFYHLWWAPEYLLSAALIFMQPSHSMSADVMYPQLLTEYGVTTTNWKSGSPHSTLADVMYPQIITEYGVTTTNWKYGSSHSTLADVMYPQIITEYSVATTNWKSDFLSNCHYHPTMINSVSVSHCLLVLPCFRPSTAQEIFWWCTAIFEPVILFKQLGTGHHLFATSYMKHLQRFHCW